MKENMLYRTKSLQMASALMSQDEFQVDYVQLDTTEQVNKFKFVLEIFTEKVDFDKWILDYTNKRVRVEPKAYDSNLNVLRDNLTLHKV